MQAEEQLQARQAGLQQHQGLGSTEPQQRAFASRLQSCVQHTALVCLTSATPQLRLSMCSLHYLIEEPIVQYEDELLQALAQSVIPMDRLIDSADKAAALSASLQEQPVRQSEDLLAQELLSWFKHDFFAWVSDAVCCLATHRANDQRQFCLSCFQVCPESDWRRLFPAML